MKTLVESIFGDMGSLTEGVFGDNITNDIPLNIEIIKLKILNALKKYNFEIIDWGKYFKGYNPQRPVIVIEDNIIDFNCFNIAIFSPNKLVYKESKNKHEGVCTGVVVNIGNGEVFDNQDPNKYYLTRVSVMFTEITEGRATPYAHALWAYDLWKKHSIKTNEINENTIKSIIKYIVNLFDLSLKMAKKDEQEIRDIYYREADECGDPLLGGKKDRYWYLDKMKKVLG